MILKGIGATNSVAIAKCIKLDDPPTFRDDEMIGKEDVEKEIESFHKAVKKTNDIFDQEIVQCGDQMVNLAIIEMHKTLLNDVTYIDGIVSNIEAGYNSVSATLRTCKSQMEILMSLDDEYLRERAIDIEDVSVKLMCILSGLPIPGLPYLEEEVILVAKDIPPSMMATLDAEKVKGIVTQIGGRTSHTAILAQSMGIAAVVGCGVAANDIKDQEIVFIDGANGIVEYQIEDSRIETLHKKVEEGKRYEKHLQDYKDKPTVTKDNKEVMLFANVMEPNVGDKLADMQVGGIGLFRTEFLYMDRKDLPLEEEQFGVYKNIVSGMNNKPVIIRTMDIGGDKEVECLTLDYEDNPFLGYRAIRICFDEIEMFKSQLKAILRASKYGNPYIMFPMIANIQEIRKAKLIYEECKEELRQLGQEFKENIPIGTMIEIPSAAIMADHLIEEVDFFSIGSNDLTQYTLAVDRMNNKISHMYSHFEPAVIHLINSSIQATKKNNKLCGLCGEMAADIRAIPLLIGLGLDEFSVSISSILQVRKLISLIDTSKAERVAQLILTMSSREEIEKCIDEEFAKEFAELKDF